MPEFAERNGVLVPKKFSIKEYGREIATVANDVRYPIYGGSDRLISRDWTLRTKSTQFGETGYAIYDEILKDPHCYAVCQKRYMEIVGREWHVEPATESDQDREVSEMITRQLKGLAFAVSPEENNVAVASGAGGFDTVVLGLLSAIVKGFSVAEILWGSDGSETYPKEIRIKDQNRFSFSYMEEAQTFTVNLLTPNDRWDGEPLPPRKFIVHTFHGEYDNPLGYGLGEKLYWPVWFKKNGIRFWLAFADKFGSPTAIGKYPANHPNAEAYRDALLSAIGKIAQEAGVAIPEDTAIEYLEATRGSTVSVYEGLSEFMNSEISKAMLGETGSTDQGGGGGSRARDEVGNSVRISIAKFDADLLADTLNRSLIRWMTDFNYPVGSVGYPKLSWKFPELEEKEDLNARVGRDTNLRELGWRLTPEKLAQVYGDGYVPLSGDSDEEEPPLVSTLGVGGTQSLMQFLGQTAPNMPRENAIAILITVFGIPEESAGSMIPEPPPPEEAMPMEGDEEYLEEGDEEYLEEGDEEYLEEGDEDTEEFAESDRPQDLAKKYADDGAIVASEVQQEWMDAIDALVQEINEKDITDSLKFEELEDRLYALFDEFSEEYESVMADALVAAELAGRYEVVNDVPVDDIEFDENSIEFKQRTCLRPDDLDKAGRRCGKRAKPLANEKPKANTKAKPRNTKPRSNARAQQQRSPSRKRSVASEDIESLKKRIAELEAEKNRKPKPGDVLDVSVDTLNFDPNRFQYKLVHGSTGSSGSLTGVQKWDANLAGVIQVWEDPANGKTYVINGHNRATLAKNLGAEKVTVRYLDVANASEARATGALTNIAEGRGNALDAAKFFRDTGINAEDLKAKGIPMKEKIATDGIALANLDDSLFSRVIDGDLPQERATVIGGSGLSHDEQRSLSNLIDSQKKTLTNEVISELIDVVKSSSSESGTQQSLFGIETVTQNLAIEKAQLQSQIRKRLSREKKLFGTVGKSTTAQELAKAGNQIDVEQSKAISQQASVTLGVFDQLKNVSGPVSALINEAAKRMANGESQSKVLDELYKELVDELPNIVGSK